MDKFTKLAPIKNLKTQKESRVEHLLIDGDNVAFEGGEISEADDNCCLCFPIKCGVTTLAVFGVLHWLLALFLIYAFVAVVAAAGGLKYALKPLIGLVIVCGPLLLAGFFCLMYLMNDNSETRQKMVWG